MIELIKHGHIQRLGSFRVEDTGCEYTYDSILTPGTEVVDQAMVDQVRMEIVHPRLTCLCHPVGPIAMHFQRRRKEDKIVRFWDNRNNDLVHVKDCPRARAEDVRESKQHKLAASGEKVYLGKDGLEHSDSNVGDLFADDEDEEDRPRKSSPVRVDTAESEWDTDSTDGTEKRTGTIRVGRGKTKFGGLIRNWYVIGYKWAADYAKTRDGAPIPLEDLSMQNVLWGMWTVLYKQLIEANGEPLEKIAFVPHQSRRGKRRNNEHKLIFGVVGKIRETEDQRALEVNVHGIGDRWVVRIPRGKIPTRPSRNMWGNRLIAVRAVFHGAGEHYEATHRPFLVHLVEPGGVWVDSTYEAKLYHELRYRKFQIEKPLRETDEFYEYRPDFVLRGFHRPVVIEVYGVQNVVSYDEHKDTHISSLVSDLG